MWCFPNPVGMREKQSSAQHFSWKVLNVQGPSFQGTLQVEIKTFKMDVAGEYMAG